MRPVTRNLVLALLAVMGLLLALGAVPGLLRTGEPYHVRAAATAADGDRTAVPGDALSPRRYPYVTDAVARAGDGGRSDPYWRGPLGVKDAFTHSPFDELSALGEQYPNATAGDGVYLRSNGTTYRLTVEREGAG